MPDQNYAYVHNAFNIKQLPSDTLDQLESCSYPKKLIEFMFLCLNSIHSEFGIAR